MIKPLKNQVLVRLIPHDAKTENGLVIPDVAVNGDPLDKPKPRKAHVLAIGQWKTTKQGLSILPDFHVGQRVLIKEHGGTKLSREIGENLKLIRVDDVLAVLEEELIV